MDRESTSITPSPTPTSRSRSPMHAATPGLRKLRLRIRLGLRRGPRDSAADESAFPAVSPSERRESAEADEGGDASSDANGSTPPAAVTAGTDSERRSLLAWRTGLGHSGRYGFPSTRRRARAAQHAAAVLAARALTTGSRVPFGLPDWDAYEAGDSVEQAPELAARDAASRAEFAVTLSVLVGFSIVLFGGLLLVAWMM